MANTLTFTGNLGPGNAVTSLVFNGVQNLFLDYIKGIAIIVYTLANGSNRTQSVQLSGITTLTHTISGTTYTIALS